MIFTILNTSFERVGDIDNAISSIWDKHYREAGYVEICAAATSRAVSLLKKGFYITRDDDPCVARIYAITKETTEDDGDVIIAGAKFAQAVLGQRIIWNTTNIKGKAEEVARSLIVDNCMSPTDQQGVPMPARIIPELELGELHGLPDTIGDTQVSFENLLTYVLEICATFHYGLRAIIKPNKIAIEIYKGKDRSYDQAANPFIVFSQENENLLSSTYKYDGSGQINAALVGGEGEGLQRARASVGTAEGLDRYEVFVDAKDITSTTKDGDGEEKTLTPEEYKALLVERGRLNMVQATESLDAAVDLLRNYKYRHDFDVGDIVTIFDQHLGAYVNVRLMSMLESEDASGYALTPTFAFDY